MCCFEVYLVGLVLMGCLMGFIGFVVVVVMGDVVEVVWVEG